MMTIVSIRSRITKIISGILGLAFLLLSSGCGRQEAGGSMVGSAAGAMLGASVSRDPLAGALIGGLVGGAVGGSVGRAGDAEEEHQERRHRERAHARQHAANEQKLAQAHEENRALRKAMKKWCCNCQHESSIIGANRCASCGSRLITEKFCRCCLTTFNARSGCHYCPYCPEGVRLDVR